MNVDVPIVGDFHYIGHKLLADHPACAEALDKYRINPGNVGFKEKKDRQFAAIVETAIRHDKPVRIGANWGSLDQELLTHLMDENARSNHPDGRSRRDARSHGAIGAAVRRTRRRDRPAAIQDHPLGQGVGRAGFDRRLRRAGAAFQLCAASRPYRGRHGLEGHRRLVGGDGRVAAARHRRHHPHLAHARAEWRPHPGSQSRAGVVADARACAPSCRWSPPARAAAAPPRPLSRSLPPASRASSAIQCRSGRRAIRASKASTSRSWAASSTAPARCKHADIGISLPGTGEQPTAPVFIDGKKAMTLRGPTVVADFQKIVIDYIEQRFGSGGAGRTAAE